MHETRMSTIEFDPESRGWALEHGDFDRPLRKLRWIADDIVLIALDVELGVIEGERVARLIRVGREADQ